MPIISHNLELYGYGFEEWSQYWGNIKWQRVLDSEYPDEEASWTTSVSLSTEVGFIYLNNVKQKYYIDGTVTGHIKVTNDSSTTDYTLGRCGIRLAKIDRIGTETNLGGFKRLRTDVVTKSNATYIAIQFKFDIIEEVIEPNEKLILYVDIQKGGDVYEGDIHLLHGTDTTYGNDLHLRLPLTTTI